MSGFLAGLVQRGAGLGAGAVLPAMAAPRSYASEAAPFSLEAPRQAIDVSPVAPESRRDNPAAAPRTPESGAALAPDPVGQVGKVDAVPATRVSEVPQTPVAPVNPVVTRPAAAITASPRIELASVPSRAREPTSQPPTPADKPENIPVQETPATVIAAPAPRAQSADRAGAPESPRIEVNARDAVAMPEVSTAATSTLTPVREPPVTVLTAARSVRSVDSQLPPRPAPAPEPPPIHVRIGKVEVRAPTPAASTPAPARQSVAPAPRGFTAYRRLRTYRK